ncbi:hypothetical protein AAMO2058_001727600 [Amorphochlora amoebiformis]
MAPRDPVLGVTEAYNKDPRPEKINLGVGAYRDAAGKPWVLPSVRMAEKLIFRRNITHEYAPLRGTNGLVERSIQIVYGHESPQIKHNCIAAIQSLSGTGALRLCGEFLSRFSKSQEVYVSNPTWENHISIFRDAGLEVQRYRYYDNKTRSLDFEGMVEDLSKAPQGSIIVIQALGHNPTGIDPTWSQWKQICQCCKNKKHLIIFDLAYQGMVSGDLDKDVQPLRHFVQRGHQVAVCQSYSKNFGLYGERVGTLSFVCKDAVEAQKVESQLKTLARSMYSSSPIYGAIIVNTILSNPQLKKQWRKDLQAMAIRITNMRSALTEALQSNDNRVDWSHINKTTGMFCYSGLSTEQAKSLAVRHSIYVLDTGRISIAGITDENVFRIASAIAGIRRYSQYTNDPNRMRTP